MYNEFQYKWTWSSAATTGAGSVQTVLGKVERFTLMFTTDAGCTCTGNIQGAASSGGPFVSIGTASNPTTSACVITQFAGPVPFVRPYLTDKSTGGLTIELFGN